MEIQTDYLIIGTGIAGLTFALQASQTGSVAIVTKKEKRETSTNYAQGGIASVFDPEDRFDYHIKDTLEAGCGLCREDIVRMVVEGGPDGINALMSLGGNLRMMEESIQKEPLDAPNLPNLLEMTSMSQESVDEIAAVIRVMQKITHVQNKQYFGQDQIINVEEALNEELKQPKLEQPKLEQLTDTADED